MRKARPETAGAAGAAASWACVSAGWGCCWGGGGSTIISPGWSIAAPVAIVAAPKAVVAAWLSSGPCACAFCSEEVASCKARVSAGACGAGAASLPASALVSARATFWGAHEGAGGDAGGGGGRTDKVSARLRAAAGGSPKREGLELPEPERLHSTDAAPALLGLGSRPAVSAGRASGLQGTCMPHCTNGWNQAVVHQHAGHAT